MEHYFKIYLLTPPRLSFLSTYKAEADLEQTLLWPELGVAGWHHRFGLKEIHCQMFFFYFYRQTEVTIWVLTDCCGLSVGWPL